MRHTIKITDGVPRHPLYRMAGPVNFSLDEGEQLALVGPNGGGKSLLVDILMGKWPLLMDEVRYDFGVEGSALVCDHIKYISFRDSYGDSDSGFYYQQRWNSQDMETTPVVADLLPTVADFPLRDMLYDFFGMLPLLDKHIVMLSSGELRKFQLTKTLLTNPSVLILDNPFIGLDAGTRGMLQDLLEVLVLKTGLQVILVLSKPEDIPPFVTHVIPVRDRLCGAKVTLSDYLSQDFGNVDRQLSPQKERLLLELPDKGGDDWSQEVVKLNGVSICYGGRTILDNLDWTVCRGERWALRGDNGSGKSTLLSLVCADNPQSYACDISLFGRKRGTGESIWEIKKHIGYVSPEMHRAYLKNLPAVDIVASGLHDSVGLYRRPSAEGRAVCGWWMDLFGISDLKDRSFLQLSSGEQRLVLLARAFVKDPELLVLDEPLHGLDGYNRRLVKDIIEAFCRRRNKTLIMVTHYQEELPACITHSLHLSPDLLNIH